jgi:hypothetical protein
VQGTAVSQSVQPLGICLQVLTPVPEHHVAPTVHWLTQLLTQVPPEQNWPTGQKTAVSQSVHPLAFFLQVATPEPEHWTAPSEHWSVQLLTHAPPEQI